MRGQTVRKAAFLASASGTTQGSCAPTTCRPCGPPSGQRVVELWRLAPATSTLHCPRDSTARAAECAGLSRRPASALEQGLCLILRYFPSFVFFAFKHVSGLFLWYTVCLFPVPRDSHLSSVMENSQPLFLHFCLIHSTYSFLGNTYYINTSCHPITSVSSSLFCVFLLVSLCCTCFRQFPHLPLLVH